MFEDVADEVEQPDEAVVLHSVVPRLQVLPLDDGPVHPTSQTLQIYHFCNIKFNWLEDIRFFKMKVKNQFFKQITFCMLNSDKQSCSKEYLGEQLLKTITVNNKNFIPRTFQTINT